MDPKIYTLLKFAAFLCLVNLLIGISMLVGAQINEKKLIMFESTIDPKGNSVATTPIYAYCAHCTCKDK